MRRDPFTTIAVSDGRAGRGIEWLNFDNEDVYFIGMLKHCYSLNRLLHLRMT